MHAETSPPHHTRLAPLTKTNIPHLWRRSQRLTCTGRHVATPPMDQLHRGLNQSPRVGGVGGHPPTDPFFYIYIKKKNFVRRFLIKPYCFLLSVVSSLFITHPSLTLSCECSAALSSSSQHGFRRREGTQDFSFTRHVVHYSPFYSPLCL